MGDVVRYIRQAGQIAQLICLYGNQNVQTMVHMREQQHRRVSFSVRFAGSGQRWPVWSWVMADFQALFTAHPIQWVSYSLHPARSITGWKHHLRVL